MYTWPTNTSKTTIHGMNPGWKMNPSPYQSPDPSPTYTETERSPVYESSSEPGSERREQSPVEVGNLSPIYSPEPEAWSSPTYSPDRQDRENGLISGSWNWAPVREEPTFRIKANGLPSRFDVAPELMNQWKSISLWCAQRLEKLKKETMKIEIAEKGGERSGRSDRYSPYNRRLEHGATRRSPSTHGSSAIRRHRGNRHHKDHRDDSFKREDRRRFSSSSRR